MLPIDQMSGDLIIVPRFEIDITWNGWKAFYIPYPHFILLDKTRIWLGKHVSQEFIKSVLPSATHPSIRPYPRFILTLVETLIAIVWARETANVKFFFWYFIKPRVVHVFIRFYRSGPIKQRINLVTSLWHPLHRAGPNGASIKFCVSWMSTIKILIPRRSQQFLAVA